MSTFAEARALLRGEAADEARTRDELAAALARGEDIDPRELAMVCATDADLAALEAETDRLRRIFGLVALYRSRRRCEAEKARAAAAREDFERRRDAILTELRDEDRRLSRDFESAVASLADAADAERKLLSLASSRSRQAIESARARLDRARSELRAAEAAEAEAAKPDNAEPLRVGRLEAEVSRLDDRLARFAKDDPHRRDLEVKRSAAAAELARVKAMKPGAILRNARGATKAARAAFHAAAEAHEAAILAAR